MPQPNDKTPNKVMIVVIQAQDVDNAESALSNLGLNTISPAKYRRFSWSPECHLAGGGDP